MANVIEKILYLMEVEGVSGNKLTSALGISSSSITEWKKGKMKPSVEAIVKIAQYFRVTTDYLLYDEVDLPLGAPAKFTESEIMVLNRTRELIKAGLTWEDITRALSFPGNRPPETDDEMAIVMVFRALSGEGRKVALNQVAALGSLYPVETEKKELVRAV